MDAYSYETFVRSAFGYPGSMIERGADPASLANTDIFKDRHLNQVKIATGYSMEVFTTDIINNVEDLPDKEFDRIEGFRDLVMKSNDVVTISKLIEDFRSSVIKKYYNINDGRMTLK
jgi:hypothetical protein